MNDFENPIDLLEASVTSKPSEHTLLWEKFKEQYYGWTVDDFYVVCELDFRWLINKAGHEGFHTNRMSDAPPAYEVFQAGGKRLRVVCKWFR